MISYEKYVAGWLDSSILDFLVCLPANASSMKYALITCLDSNPNVNSLLETSPDLKSLMSEAKVLDQGLVLRAKTLLEATSGNQVFFGFDEIWFFPDEPIEPKPDSISLVGPSRIDQETLNRLGTWLSDNSCSLALGDGEGLNFIVKAAGLVRYLLGHSIRQTAPTCQPTFELKDGEVGGILSDSA